MGLLSARPPLRRPQASRPGWLGGDGKRGAGTRRAARLRRPPPFGKPAAVGWKRRGDPYRYPGEPAQIIIKLLAGSDELDISPSSSFSRSYRFLRLFGSRCESALPAAVFDALPVRPSRRTLEAAEAARLDVFFATSFSPSFGRDPSPTAG